MNKLSEIIIWGGGNSISEGLSLGLKDKIKDKPILVCNHGYNHIDASALVCVDADFYLPKAAKLEHKDDPDIYDKLKELPLILACNHNKIAEFVHPNTFLLNHSSFFNKNPLKNGFYTKRFLTGIFALSIAYHLIDYNGVIYCLGFDWNVRPIEERLKYKERLINKGYNGEELHHKLIHTEEKTHYYSKKEIPHRGQGFVGSYELNKPNDFFKVFVEPNVKIYNVSLNSTIPNFEKISYQTFFSLLSSKKYNQSEVIDCIKSKLSYNKT